MSSAYKNDEMVKKVRTQDFVENNGEVMRAINAIPIGYLPLKTVRKVLPKMTDMEFLKSLNYLQLKGYLLVRNINSRAAIEIADGDYIMLEARLSATGIDLSDGTIVDARIDT